MFSNDYRKIIDIIVFITQYNFHAGLFVEKNKGAYDSKSIESLLYRSANDWLTDDIFYNALQFYLRELEVNLSIDYKQLYKAPYLSNDITPYDEPLTQHYCDYPTTILDWTYNPFVGLYFSLLNPLKKLKDANHLYFSLCMCEKPLEHNNYAFFVDPEPNEHNLRIKRQEGLFLRIKIPVSFYYKYGHWPSIEQLVYYFPFLKRSFPITRYNIFILLTQQVRNILSEMGINENFLLPKLEVPA